MSIISSFYIGASGLAANSLELSVVGDNIANSNTIGFKASRAAFEDVVAQSVIGGSGQLGAGTRVQSVQKILSQGAITSTGVATDLAIQGDGFFIVNGRDGAQYYTRAGQMGLDEDGFLVNLEGLRVQGFEASPTGVVSAGLTDLNLTGVQAAPSATSEITLRGNLTADPSEELVGPFDITDPSGTSNLPTTIEVFDSLGNAHGVDVYFTKNGPGNWTWTATGDGILAPGGTPGTPVVLGSGDLTFDTDGNLTGISAAEITISPPGATPGQVIELNLGDPLPTGTGAAGMVQQSLTPSSISFIGQDGFGSGDIAGVRIDDSGNVVGTFTNGQTRVLGQIAVAQFAAADQLDRVGGNLYATSATSGDPNIGVAGTGGRGSIVAGALEQSNVDLSQEFIRMIVAQRAFQANSKTIQTADQLLQELIQVKR